MVAASVAAVLSYVVPRAAWPPHLSQAAFISGCAAAGGEAAGRQSCRADLLIFPWSPCVLCLHPLGMMMVYGVLPVAAQVRAARRSRQCSGYRLLATRRSSSAA